MQKIDIQQIKQTVLDTLYPVGSVYTNATVSTNPSSLLGFGTWVAFGAGRVPVGVDTGQAEFDTVGETGGAKTVALTTGQLPIHSIGFSHHGDEGGSVIRSPHISGGVYTESSIGAYRPPSGAIGGAGSSAAPKWTFGNDEAHNNLQPYITVYMWKRTA